ncbi:MAG TPA: HEAT repeat domain-containing protein [Bryobacteraceae bacterium]|nr:HEAT repeat domain-containing protein [Bryobacteraceae bacterium]
MYATRSLLLALLTIALLPAQEAVRTKDVRETAKGGANSIPQLQQYMKNPDIEIRLEAVKQIVEVGGPRTLDPLIQATTDNDPEVQIRATDGLVNFYLPGYVRTGFGSSLRRVGGSIKGKFTETNDQVIDPFVKVRPDVIAALGKLARGGGNMDVRANAARAIGILRGQPALADLIEALRSKDSGVIYESLIAIQKIRDQSAAPRIAFLLRDFDPKVQIAVIETTGLLQNKEALPGLVDVLQRTREDKVRRAALTAIAMLPDEQNRPHFARYINDRKDDMRAAAAEGYARLKNPSDLPMLEKAWNEEKKTQARLSFAFALAMLGKTEISEFSPLQYLVNTLNTTSWRNVAYPFLVELARDPGVRKSLYAPMLSGSKDEKIYLARVMARTGDPEAVPHLEKLSHDGDQDVAAEGLRALRTLKAVR